jgi:hypothetical protein
MKMSLSEMTCRESALYSVAAVAGPKTHILMLQVLQELQFAVCSLGQDWRAERLHNLLHSDALVGEVIFGGAVHKNAHQSAPCINTSRSPIAGEKVNIVPNQAKGAHSNRLKVRVPAGEGISIAAAKRGHSRWRSSRLDGATPRTWM